MSQQWFVVGCELMVTLAATCILSTGEACCLAQALPLEQSQFLGAGHEAEAEPLVLAAWALQQLCFNFHPSPDWLLQLTALPERGALNKDDNSL